MKIKKFKIKVKQKCIPKKEIVNKNVSGNKRKNLSSNYAYGRKQENKIGRIVNFLAGGTYQRRSTGSRGASDVTVYKNSSPIFDIQVKSSRAKTVTYNINSMRDRLKIILYAQKNGTIPLIANVKGGHPNIYRADTGRKVYQG